MGWAIAVLVQELLRKLCSWVGYVTTSIGAVCLGGAWATMNTFFCGEAGCQHFLGYTMMGRAT
jgi:hypothetical protein